MTDRRDLRCGGEAAVFVPFPAPEPKVPRFEPRGEGHATITMADHWDGIGGADENDW